MYTYTMANAELKSKIIDIITQDLKTIIPGIKSKVYSDEEIKLYIKKNLQVINGCITDYIEDFGGYSEEEFDEDWVRDYLSEYCVN